MEEELTCAICCDIFSEPRVLPCSHTFCLPCLRDLLQPSLPGPGGRSLSCPSCRAVLPVPAAGPEALPVNFALKAVIEKFRQEEAPGEGAGAEAETCRAHPRQPLNVYCLQDRQLVCGQCLTIGEHRGHPIDDLQSVYRKAREASGRLLEELMDPSRSKVFSCSERLQQQKAWCQSTLQRNRNAVLKYFKDLGDALEQKKAALLSSLDELEGRVLEQFDPLIEEVEKLKLEERELRELHSAVQEEESPLLFLQKLAGLQQRFQALKQRQLPNSEPVKIQPRVEDVLQDMSKTALGEVPKIHTPKLHLAHLSQGFGKQCIVSALRFAFTQPGIILLLVLSVVSQWYEEGTLPAPLEHLCKFLLQIWQDFCTYLQDRTYQLCYTSALPMELCRTIFPDDFDY